MNRSDIRAIFKQLGCMGLQLSYDGKSPAPLSTPIAIGFAEDPEAQTPDLQVSMTTPHILNTNIDACNAFEEQTGNRYSLCAAGYISLKPALVKKLGITSGCLAKLPADLIIELSDLLTPAIKGELGVSCKAMTLEISCKPKWDKGFMALDLALSIPCTAEAWTNAKHLAEIQVAAGNAISTFWELRDASDAAPGTTPDTESLLNKFRLPPGGTQH